MPRAARVPEVDLTNPVFVVYMKALGELVRQRGSDMGDFLAAGQVVREVMADGSWAFEEEMLRAATTDADMIMVDEEAYRRIDANEYPVTIYHGLYGSHRISEPLYRRSGVHNGPTIKPLACRLGIVEGSLLPSLAVAAGGLMALLPSREAKNILTQLGFRPPSRTTLENRVGALYSSMAICVRELESECREQEASDFEIGAISCGLDRFATRMVETLPEGPTREEKLAKRRPIEQYERTPPEPAEINWRMSWAANVTLYDVQGVARKSLRYGTDAGSSSSVLSARLVDDILHIVGTRKDIAVACVQDGARDLEPLRDELNERLPKSVPRHDLVDFYHAMGYLDAVEAARSDVDGPSASGFYRLQLLNHDDGSSRVIKHLKQRLQTAEQNSTSKFVSTLEAAITYFENRRHQTHYAAAREAGLPIGSGATESTCALFQHRVKLPGSGWKPSGLRGAMTAKGLYISGRWYAAFVRYQITLKQEVRAA